MMEAVEKMEKVGIGRLLVLYSVRLGRFVSRTDVMTALEILEEFGEPSGRVKRKFELVEQDGVRLEQTVHL
jgi:hypothetical protein